MYLHKGNEQCHERVLPRIYKLRLWVKADRVKCGYQEISAFFCLMLKLKLCRKVKATPSKLGLLNLTKKLDPAGFSHGSNLDIQGDRWQVQGSGPSSHTGNQHGLFPWMDTQFSMYSPLSNVQCWKGSFKFVLFMF